MAGFNDRFSARAASAIAALGAETITYTPAGAAGISVEAIVNRESMKIEHQGGDRALEVVRTVSVALLLADVAVPAVGDKITFDPAAVEGGSTVGWAVVSIDSCFGGIATLTCEARTDSEVRAPGFRRER